MQLPTLLLTLLATTTLAAPQKRACSITYPIGTTSISLSKPAPSVPSSTQTIAFTTPANAGGPCSLIATFPAGYPIASAGDARVNVIDVNGPAPGAIVGTVTFAAGETRTINSFACRRDMRYRLELATEGTGSVQFNQAPGAGVAITYSC